MLILAIFYANQPYVNQPYANQSYADQFYADQSPKSSNQTNAKAASR